MRLVCDNCGYINKDPEHRFEKNPEAELEVNKVYWLWVCQACQVVKPAEYITPEQAEKIVEGDLL